MMRQRQEQGKEICWGRIESEAWQEKGNERCNGSLKAKEGI